jgi:hypothetical protein
MGRVERNTRQAGTARRYSDKEKTPADESAGVDEFSGYPQASAEVISLTAQS